MNAGASAISSHFSSPSKGKWYIHFQLLFGSCYISYPAFSMKSTHSCDQQVIKELLTNLFLVNLIAKSIKGLGCFFLAASVGFFHSPD
jgi:hypothetical protein